MLFALLVQLNRNIVFEFEMNEAISKPLCDDVIVSNDKIEEDDVENENESIELDKKKKKARLTTTKCWKFYTRIGVGKDGKEKTKCNACGKKKKYVTGGKKICYFLFKLSYWEM